MRTLITFLLASLIAFSQTPMFSPNAFTIAVLSGAEVTHASQSPVVAPVSIRVADPSGQPIQGAVAIFAFPETGPSATFSDGSNVKALLTDSEGKAAVEIRSNNLPGSFDPTITINWRGQSTLVRLHHTNASTVTGPALSRATKSKKKWYIIAAVAAGGATAVLLATKGKKTTTTTTTPTGGGITITPGSGSVGGN